MSNEIASKRVAFYSNEGIEQVELTNRGRRCRRAAVRRRSYR